MIRRGRLTATAGSRLIRITVATIATAAQTRSRASSTAPASHRGAGSARMPDGALAGAGIVQAPHLFLEDFVRLHGADEVRRRERCVETVLDRRIDCFHGRPLQS